MTSTTTRAKIASATVLTAAAITGIGAITQAADAAPVHARTHVAACTGSQLGLHVDAHGYGAAGHDGLVLDYRNTSHRTCSVTGYPGVDALVGHHRLDSASRTKGALVVRSITLKPGAWSSALVDWQDFGPDGKDCAGGTSLAVTAPNTTRTIRLAHTATGCELKVHPTVAGLNAGMTG